MFCIGNTNEEIGKAFYPENLTRLYQLEGLNEENPAFSGLEISLLSWLHPATGFCQKLECALGLDFCKPHFNIIAPAYTTFFKSVCCSRLPTIILVFHQGERIICTFTSTGPDKFKYISSSLINTDWFLIRSARIKINPHFTRLEMIVLLILVVKKKHSN